MFSNINQPDVDVLLHRGPAYLYLYLYMYICICICICICSGCGAWRATRSTRRHSGGSGHYSPRGASSSNYRVNSRALALSLFNSLSRFPYIRVD